MLIFRCEILSHFIIVNVILHHVHARVLTHTCQKHTKPKMKQADTLKNGTYTETHNTHTHTSTPDLITPNSISEEYKLECLWNFLHFPVINVL
jgi:hypothetical protein